MLYYENAIDFDGVQLAPSGFFRAGYRGMSIRDNSYIGFPKQLLQCADARLGFINQHPAPGIQAYGANYSTATTGGNVDGVEVDGSTLRFGRVADPDDAGKWCWHIRVHPDDPLTASSKRGEFSHNSLLSRPRHFESRTVGLCTRLQDWRGLTDSQLFWQWHADDDLAAAGNPWLAAYVRAGEMVVQVRYDTRETPVAQTIVELYATEDWTPETWDRWAIHTRTGYDGSGLVQIMRNGALIANYAGPVGVNENGVGTETSYFKNGYYHWVNSGNDWDTSVNTREVWQKGAYIAVGGVSLSEMDDYLSSL